MAGANITRRGAVAAIAAAVAAPAIAAPVAGLQSSADATAARLWAERQAAVDRLRAASEAYDEASAKLPAWAQSGPRMIDRDGHPCGDNSGWPLDASVKPSPHGGNRVVRPTIAECVEQFNFQVRVFEATGTRRSEARALMRSKIRAITARLRERERLYQRLGLTELSRQSETARADMQAAEYALYETANATPNVIAARLLIAVCDHCSQGDMAAGNGYCGTMALALVALTPLLPNLSGLIRDHTAFFVANPTLPLGSMPFAPV